jgi:four helix bundle protein
MNSFKDPAAFQRALKVVVAVYDLTAHFPKHEMYGLVAQMRRAAISVLSNVAEGQGRLTYGEWRKALSDARGSLFEVEAQCIAAHELRFINDRELQETTRLIVWAGRALSGLIAWVLERERSGKPPRSNRAATPQQPAVSSPLQSARANPQARGPRT